MWRRNAIVLLTAATAVVTLAALAQANRHLYSNLDSDERLAAALFLFVCVAIASFLNLRGGFWTRTGLVVLVPVVLSLAGEAFNRDAAYQGIGFVVGAVVATVTFLACVFIGGPIFLWRQRKDGAT